MQAGMKRCSTKSGTNLFAKSNCFSMFIVAYTRSFESGTIARGRKSLRSLRQQGARNNRREIVILNPS